MKDLSQAEIEKRLERHKSDAIFFQRRADYYRSIGLDPRPYTAKVWAAKIWIEHYEFQLNNKHNG